MTYDKLLDLAEKENLVVKEADLRLYDGLIRNNKIAIRQTLPAREKKQVLAEEIGHARTSAGDIIDYRDPNNLKQEMGARLAGYELLVGIDGIIKAYEAGCRNLYEMAELLGVTEEYLQDAMERYHGKYGLYVSYKDYCVIFEPSLAVIKML